MPFGWGKGSDSDSDSDSDKKQKKKQEEEEQEEHKEGRRPGGRRPGHGRHGKDDEAEEDERPEKKHGGRPGRHGRPEAEEEEEEAKGGRRPGRHHRKEEDEPEAAGRPGRHGRKDEEEHEGGGRRPGRHGRTDEEDEPEAPSHGHGGGRPEGGHHRPGRPGPHEEQEAGHEAEEGGRRPGRHGRKDEEEEEHSAPSHGHGAGRPHRPGRPGRHEEQETGHEECGGGRPGRHGRKDEEEEHAAAGQGHGQHHAPAPHQPPSHGGGHGGSAGGQEHGQHHAPAPHQPPSHGGGHGGQGHGQQHEPAPHQPPSHSGGSGGTVTVSEGQSIQDALNCAQPGTTILLEAGTYNESLKTRVDGTKEQPITIKGPSSGATAIVKGDDKSGTCVEINHDFYILDDFTICGQINDHPNKDNVKECFREKCLAIRGKREHRSMKLENGDHFLSSVEGVTVKNMKINNCGGEGIRLRYFVTHCTIFHNQITSTGCFDFKFGGDQGIKNGEGIYIGTSSNQWEKNLTGEQDICRWNRVYENYIDTHGNECVDVKEGAMDTVIERNYCTGQLDEDSAGIDSRASTTIIRYNKIVGCKGAGVRLGGHKVGNDQYGIACQVYGNILKDNEYGGIKVMTEPHTICQNTITGPGHKYKIFRGECAKSFEENCECPFDVDPPSQDIETSRWFQNCKP